MSDLKYRSIAELRTIIANGENANLDDQTQRAEIAQHIKTLEAEYIRLGRAIHNRQQRLAAARFHLVEKTPPRIVP